MKSLTLFLQKHYQVLYNLFLFLIATVVVLYVLPEHGRLKYDYEVGQPWLHKDLEAPFNFPLYKSREQVRSEKKAWEESHPLYFNLKEESENQSIADWKESAARVPNSVISNSDSLQLIGTQMLEDIFNQGVVVEPSITIPRERIWYISSNGVFQTVDPDALLSPKSAIQIIQERINDVADSSYRAFLKENLPDFVRPNIRFNNDLTQRRKTEFLRDISPTQGMVSEGEVIVYSGQIVDEAIANRLSSYRRTLEGTDDPTSIWQVRAGHFLLVVLILSMLYLFLQQFRPTILENSNSLTLILVNLIGMVLLADLVVGFNPDLLYIVPFPIVPIILRSFYDTRLALFIHFIVIMMVGLVAPNSFEFIFIQFLAGVFSIVTATGLYRRAQLFLASGKITVIYIISYFAFTLIRGDVLDQEHLYQYGYFALNGLMSIVAYPLIFLFEKIFGQVSDVTLLELGDTNSPLLRELRIKAPGTFQHSLQVGNLAESVIDEIGGNTLLVRTGALYHDIGKMKNPLYFVENQTTGVNAHDELEPIESAKVIVDHVLEGIVMAKSRRVPDMVIDFIRTHHGTTRVEYFYRNHLRKLQEADMEISKEEEDKFRYPGPKPFSKETAVMMMADTVEAATRSLNRPTAEDISNMVDKLIDHQQSEGQFDNANITLGEISRARQVLKKKLMSIHHLRVEYPD
ncbi:MAG: HDIG domain-containing protein [Flavobacteriia bacterium]|nr:HDIG domain-containing protein [Flavobacteriia bacterium]